MKFSSYPVVEVEVKGEKLRFEQDNGSMHVGTSVWPCSLVLLKWMETHVASLQARREKPQDHDDGHGHVNAHHGHGGDDGDAQYGHGDNDGDAVFDLQGKHGIELGSGCGVAGLGFALLGLNTLLTDITPVLPALKRNVKKNVAATSLRCPGTAPSFSGKVKISQLYWGNSSQISALKSPFDYIIATDVVYIENIVEPLLSTLNALSGPSTIIFLGYQVRSPEAHELFWRLCPELFYVKKVPHENLHPDYAFEEADVFILKKKS